MSRTPTVSVCMITYNHEKYIKEAIEGVLMQQCNFDLELVIANDCSTDETDAIVKDIIKNHPEAFKIYYYNQKRNVGVMANFLFALNQCKGKYIAMCEGDDYWITTDKLKKQVNILENNKDVGLVYSNFKHFIQNKSEWVDIPPRFENNRQEIIPKMLKSKFIEFPTTVFRKSILMKILTNLGKEFQDSIIGDTRILLETVYFTKIYFLDEVTTVYRIHDESVSHPKEVNKYICTLKDSYLLRKNFVKRYKLNELWLSHSICNTNRALINKAFYSKKFHHTIIYLKSILIIDTVKYCEWKVFRAKINSRILIKLFFAIFGLGVLWQKIK